MRVGEAFPSKWLKADDLQGRRVTVTIDSYEIEEIGQERDRKPVLYFAGKDKGLALNSTNAYALVDDFGTDDMDSWIGRKVELRVERVDFRGKRVNAIRVSGVVGGGGRQQAPPPEEPEPPQDGPDDSYSDPDDDDIPF